MIGPPATARLFGLVRSARPRHWVKNLACFAGLVFSGRLTRIGPVVDACLAFSAFCLAASAVYLFNDVLDRDRDRLDPEKRGRPIASGVVPASWALGGSAVLAVGSVGIAWGLGPRPMAVLVTYLGLSLAYCVRLKHAVLVDVLIIAIGFVFRVLLGVYAVGVRPTPWVVLCMFFLALFLGFAKRRHEIGRAEADGPDSGLRRPVLEKYDIAFLDPLLTMTATMAILCYALYTVTGRPDRPMLVVTVPIVVYGVIRYLVVVLARGGGGSPESDLVSDRVLIATVMAWLVACAAILYLPPLAMFEP